MKKLLLVVLLLFAFGQAAEYKKIPQWYYQIKSAKAQKQAFFEILRPLVEKENAKIAVERSFVLGYFARKEAKAAILEADRKRLRLLAKKYRIKNLEDKEAFLRKIDTIPISLVLAQAALESGWGKSRFARIANNIFGEWTWGKRGIVPKHRKPGQKHKIKIFDSLQEAIASYMLNLNRHRAYREFRYARALARKEGRPFSGLAAAMTMKNYSAIGKRYTKLVSSIIRKHKLNQID